MADDYCVSAGANVSTMFAFARSNYLNWSGRFSYFIHVWIFSLFGPRAFGPILAIVVIGWIFLLKTVFLLISRRYDLDLKQNLAWIQALSLVLITIETAPSKFQSFLWRDGFIAHTLPMIWLTLAILTFFKLSRNEGLPRWYAYPTLFFIVLIAGGFAETSSSSFLTLYTLLLGLSMLPAQDWIKPAEKRLLFVALLAATTAFLIEYLSPGNSMRQSLLPTENQNLFRIITFSVRNVLVIIGKYLVFTPHMALLAVGSGFSVLGYQSKWQCSMKQFIGITAGLLSGLLILLLSIASPIVVLIQAYPDDRIVTIANFYITIAMMAGGFFLNARLKHLSVENRRSIHSLLRNGIAVSVVLVITLVSIFLGNELASDFQTLKDYALRWDRREVQVLNLKKQAETTVVVPGLESRDLVSDIVADPTDWVNSCMASYYDVDEIIGK